MTHDAGVSTQPNRRRRQTTEPFPQTLILAVGQRLLTVAVRLGLGLGLPIASEIDPALTRRIDSVGRLTTPI